MIKSFVHKAITNHLPIQNESLFVVRQDPLYLTDGSDIICAIFQKDYLDLEVQPIVNCYNLKRNMFYIKIKSVNDLFIQNCQLKATVKMHLKKSRISIEFIGIGNYLAPVLIIQDSYIENIKKLLLPSLNLIIQDPEIKQLFALIRKGRLANKARQRHPKIMDEMLSSMISEAQLSASHQYVPPFFELDKTGKHMIRTQTQDQSTNGLVISEMGLIPKEYYEMDMNNRYAPLEDEVKTDSCVSNSFLRTMVEKLSTLDSQCKTEHYVDLEGEEIDTIYIQCECQEIQDQEQHIEPADLKKMTPNEIVQKCMEVEQPLVEVSSMLDVVLAEMQEEDQEKRKKVLEDQMQVQGMPEQRIKRWQQQVIEENSEEDEQSEDCLLRGYKKRLQDRDRQLEDKQSNK